MVMMVTRRIWFGLLIAACFFAGALALAPGSWFFRVSLSVLPAQGGSLLIVQERSVWPHFLSPLTAEWTASVYQLTQTSRKLVPGCVTPKPFTSRYSNESQRFIATPAEWVGGSGCNIPPVSDPSPPPVFEGVSVWSFRVGPFEKSVSASTPPFTSTGAYTTRGNEE